MKKRREFGRRTMRRKDKKRRRSQLIWIEKCSNNRFRPQPRQIGFNRDFKCKNWPRHDHWPGCPLCSHACSRSIDLSQKTTKKLLMTTESCRLYDKCHTWHIRIGQCEMPSRYVQSSFFSMLPLNNLWANCRLLNKLESKLINRKRTKSNVPFAIQAQRRTVYSKHHMESGHCRCGKCFHRVVRTGNVIIDSALFCSVCACMIVWNRYIFKQ